MTPKVSVIIPTYNRAQRVLCAIDSVQAQSFCDYELIVVDDGSSDETGSLLSQRSDLIYLKTENQGVSAARNCGIARSQGAFIAFLDSDDIWHPEKLSRQMDFFAKNPDYQLCQTTELWMRKGRRVNPGQKHIKRAGWIFADSLKLCLISPSAVMLKKDIFERYGAFDEHLPACEDYDLWLRLTRHMPVGLIEEHLVTRFAGHSDQLSSQHSLDKHRISSLLKLWQMPDLSDTERGQVFPVLLDKLGIYANGCRKRGKETEARHYETLHRDLKNSFPPSGNLL